MKFIGIIPARLGSTRLPGKVLLPLQGKPLLHHVIDRARRIPGLHNVVVATSDRRQDDPVEEFSISQGIRVYRGSEGHVARRVYEAADRADYVVRLNGDSPFLDPGLIGNGISLARSEKLDFVTNLAPRSFPYGISIEIFRRSLLGGLLGRMGASQREHVTLALYDSLEEMEWTNVRSPEKKLTRARLVVDTGEDLRRCEKFYAQDMPWEVAARQALKFESQLLRSES